MKKITNDNDLILNIVLKDTEGTVIPVSAVSSLSYTFYTKKDVYTYEVSSFVDGKIYIPSTEVANFTSGVLKYDVHIAIEDTNFPDGTQDIYYHNQNTNIYIK